MLGNQRTRKRGLVFTAEQIDALIEAARHHGEGHPRQPRGRRQQYAALFTLLAHYGARISEALALRWQDVDFEQREITLKTAKKRKPTWRTLPLLEPVARELVPLRRSAKPGDAVFGIPNRRIPYNVFKILLQKAGLPNARLHDLRHSFLSNLVERTRDVPLASEFVGHSDISITAGYLHAIRVKEKFAEMGTVYGSSPGLPRQEAVRDSPWFPPASSHPPPPVEPPTPPHQSAPPPPPSPPGQGAVPWVLPWTFGNGHAAPDTPPPGPCQVQEDVLARVANIEGAFVLLLRKLAEGENGRRPDFKAPLGRGGSRLGQAILSLRESRQPLQLGPGDAGQDALVSRPRTTLREGLMAHGLTSPTALAHAIGGTRQRADQLLRGNRFGVKVAKKIAAAVGVPFTTVLEWQEESIALEAKAKKERQERPAGV